MQESPSFNVPEDLRKSPDSILGLSRLCEADPREGKIDVGIGVVRDETGKTFTPQAVQEAYQQLDLGDCNYLGPTGEEEYLGHRQFLEETAKLIFDQKAEELLDGKKLAVIGTPGGTGAVAVMMDAYKALSPDSPVLIGIPTWPNHLQIAQSRNIPVLTYDHMTDINYDLTAHVTAIAKSPEDTLVIFHTGRTHNPTGDNPLNSDEWGILARSMNGRRAFFDTPYAGFDKGINEDTQAIRTFMEEGVPVAVGVSYAKNGGLYRERPGALLVPLSSQENAIQMQRLLNFFARVSYSSPPALGERLMATVLSSSELHGLWSTELQNAANVLQKRRDIFADHVTDFDFVRSQKGLFSMLPLKPEQITRLAKEYAIYMPSNGRINFGGVTLNDIPRLAQAIKAVLNQA
jgi:aspartate aminotransferase